MTLKKAIGIIVAATGAAIAGGVSLKKKKSDDTIDEATTVETTATETTEDTEVTEETTETETE